MPLYKEFVGDDNQICRVTFVLPDSLEAGTAYLVGEFNDWARDSMPMQLADDGIWSLQVDLEAGTKYQYRYLINGSEWHNDEVCDGYTAHPYGGENSIVETHPPA